MKKNCKGGLFIVVLLIPLCMTLFILNAGWAGSGNENEIKTIVPSGKLDEVRGLKNIVSLNEKSLSLAKEVYMGKGTCFNCHGEKGKGDGEIAESFDPRPRDFTYTKWQNIRTDGEIFWAITNGTDTGMPGFGDMLTDEEKWSLVNYIRELRKINAVANK